MQIWYTAVHGNEINLWVDQNYKDHEYVKIYIAGLTKSGKIIRNLIFYENRKEIDKKE